MEHFDVVIVGSGPGGYMSAKLLLERGKSVALVEKSVFGGVCLNAGCIPKEGLYKLALEKSKPRWKVAVQMVQGKVIEIRDTSLKTLLSKGLTYVEGDGELIDERVIKVGNRRLTASHIILACGSKQREPGISPEDVLRGWAIPKNNVCIVGGGAAGCELAFILSSFGFKVYLVRKDTVLKGYRNIPEEFALKLEDALERCGVKLVENTKNVDADLVIRATGRIPNFCQERFPFVAVDERGFVRTDSFLETDTKGIFAVGDIVPPMGAGYAFEKARVAVRSILYDKERVFDPRKVPVIISSAYQIGFVGDAKDAKISVIKPLGTNPKAYVTGNDGIISVGFDDSGRLVYCCLIGREVGEILNLCATLLGKNLEEHLSFAHPSYGEIINEILSIKQEVCR
ncbi:Dihydrolipoyl dehydrogenase [bacterium HR13]|nr:Dihydrolipoyl dehydrogenase [bacterium HR13]